MHIDITMLYVVTRETDRGQRQSSKYSKATLYSQYKSLGGSQ